MINIILQVLPDKPTLLWALAVAVSALATVVIILYKKIDALRDRNEENIKSYTRDIKGLLEKTLASFNEVEKTIIATDNDHKTTLRELILISQEKIISEMKSIVNARDRNDRKN